MARLWPDANREAGRRALATLVANRTGQGITVDGLHQFAARALIDLSNGDTKWHRVLRCIVKSHPRPTYSLEELEADLSGQPHDVPTTVAPLWWLLIPLSIRFVGSDFDCVATRILGKNICITSRQWVADKFKEIAPRCPNHAQTQMRHGKPFAIPQTFFVLRERAQSPQELWERVEPCFDVTRGVFEAVYGWGSRRWSSDSRPMRTIHWGDYGVMHCEDDRVDGLTFFYPSTTLLEHKPKTEDFGFRQGERVRMFAETVTERAGSGTVAAVAEDVLRLYSSAMDQATDEDRFLRLWQVAEALTLAGRRGGETELVAKRLGWILREAGLGEQAMVAIVKGLAKKRNRFVHTGVVGDIDQEDSNLLKIICEVSFQWLMSVRREMPTTEHLENLFELRTAPSGRLVATRAAIDYIERVRRE